MPLARFIADAPTPTSVPAHTADDFVMSVIILLLVLTFVTFVAWGIIGMRGDQQRLKAQAMARMQSRQKNETSSEQERSVE
jgi:hypothetical protein